MPQDWVNITPALSQHIVHYDRPARFPRGVRIYVDGSAGLHSSDKRLRRCGYSAVALLETDDPYQPEVIWSLNANLIGAQTTPRAELQALAQVLKLANIAGALQEEGVDIFSDCKYVVDDFHKQAWLKPDAKHRDLWHFISQKNLTKVRVYKVKSHATEEDMLLNRISVTDYIGNSLADTLAGKAAEEHRVPTPEVLQQEAVDKKAKLVIERIVNAHFIALEEQKDSIALDKLEQAKQKQFRAQQRAESKASKQAAKQRAQTRAEQLIATTTHKLTWRKNKGRYHCAKCLKSALPNEIIPWLEGQVCPGIPQLQGEVFSSNVKIEQKLLEK